MRPDSRSGYKSGRPGSRAGRPSSRAGAEDGYPPRRRNQESSGNTRTGPGSRNGRRSRGDGSGERSGTAVPRPVKRFKDEDSFATDAAADAQGVPRSNQHDRAMQRSDNEAMNRSKNTQVSSNGTAMKSNRNNEFDPVEPHSGRSRDVEMRAPNSGRERSNGKLGGGYLTANSTKSATAADGPRKKRALGNVDG